MSDRSRKIMKLVGEPLKIPKSGASKVKFKMQTRYNTRKQQEAKGNCDKEDDLYKKMPELHSYSDLMNDIRETKNASISCSLQCNLIDSEFGNIPKFKKNWLCNRPLSPISPTTALGSKFCDFPTVDDDDYKIIDRVDIISPEMVTLEEIVEQSSQMTKEKKDAVPIQSVKEMEWYEIQEVGVQSPPNEQTIKFNELVQLGKELRLSLNENSGSKSCDFPAANNDGDIIVHRVDIISSPIVTFKDILEQSCEMMLGKEKPAELNVAGGQSPPSDKTIPNEVNPLEKELRLSSHEETFPNSVTSEDREMKDKKGHQPKLIPFEQVLPEQPQSPQFSEPLSPEEPFYDSDADPEFVPTTSSDSDQDIKSPLSNTSSDYSTSSVVIPIMPIITCDLNNNSSEEIDPTFASNQSEAIPATNISGKKQKNFCYFCEDSVTNFSRHIQRNHPSEVEVVKIYSLPVSSKEKKNLLTILRKKGNYLMSAGEASPRPMKKPNITGTKLLPCSYCLGFYSSNQLWRHKKRCTNFPRNQQSRPQADGQNLLLRNLRIDMKLKEQVFPRMRADDISMIAKKDPLICAFGARYLKIHREKHFINVTSRKMRELARLLLEIRKLKPAIGNLFNALQPQNYDLFVEATKIVALYNTEKEVFKSPTYAMNIATSLKQCCDIAIVCALKRKDVVAGIHSAESEYNLKTMIHLLESNWKFDISSHAADNLNTEKWNKITLVPLATDLKLLKEYLTIKANNAVLKLTENPNNRRAYIELLETVFCRLLLLNRRRPGELERLPLYLYESSEINKQQNYEEFSDVITATEKVLMKTFKRIVITGKRKRGVPVLFCSLVQEHLKLLLSTRPNFISKSNQYLFGRPLLNTPISGYKVMDKYAHACGAKNPKALTSTRLRKHLATLTQIFNMSESDIEQLATFMGHTVGTHRKSYRLPDDVYQTAKITKLLLLMEDGGSAEHKGKSLDDIEVNLDEDLLQNNSNVDEIDSARNLEHSIDEMHFADDGYHQEEIPCKDINTTTEVTNKPRKRQLVPWTEDQKNIVKDFFKTHISKKQPPKRKECEALIEKHPSILQNKNWLKIKVFIQNQYTKK